MIFFVPVPYRADVVLAGKRNIEPAHLVAQVPVEVREAAAADLPMVARVTPSVSGRILGRVPRLAALPVQSVDYRLWQGGIVTPVRQGHSSPILPGWIPPVRVEDLGRVLSGAPRHHTLRGDRVEVLEDVEHDWGFEEPLYDVSINPFMRPVMYLDRPGTVLPENHPLRRCIVREGERDAAIAHAIHVAARSVVLDGVPMCPSNGPRLLSQPEVLSVLTDEINAIGMGAHRPDPFLCWRFCRNTGDLDAVRERARRAGWACEPHSAIQVFDRRALLSVDARMLRLESAVEVAVGCTGLAGGDIARDMASWSAARGMAWYAMRDAMSLRREGVVDMVHVAERAAEFVAVSPEGPETEELRLCHAEYARGRGRGMSCPPGTHRRTPPTPPERTP